MPKLNFLCIYPLLNCISYKKDFLCKLHQSMLIRKTQTGLPICAVLSEPSILSVYYTAVYYSYKYRNKDTTMVNDDTHAISIMLHFNF